MSDAITIQAVLRLNVAEFVAALTRARQQFSGAMGDLSGAADGVDLGDTFADVEQGAERSREAIDELGASLGDLGAGSADGLTDLAEAQADLAEAQANLTEQAEAGREALEDSGESAEGFGGSLRDLAAGLLSLDALGNIFAWIGEQIGDLMALADAWSNLKSKLDLATESEAAAALALERVQAIAQGASADLSSVGDLYATLSRALESLGDTATDVAAITETITQSFAVSGTGSAEAAGAITQLSQALASGVLRGDEFNSVMEQAPRLSRALADSLGVTTGELRSMAEEGKLTAQTVIKALGDQADVIAAEMATLPETFEGATQRLKNSLTATVGQLNEAVRGSELYAAATGTLADAIESVAGVFESLGTLLVKIVSAFTELPAPVQAAMTAMTLTGVAAALLAVNFTAVTTALASMATGLTLVALAALQAFVAQLGAALTAARALWAVLLANPLTVLVGVLAVATAGWLAYRSASEETRESLAKSREETAKQIEELNTLRATLATAKPGTDAYTEAERKLAQVVPGLTLSLNEQGQIVAKVGQGFEDNAKKVDEYAQSLEKADQQDLIRQLALTAQAQEEAKQAAQAHTQQMRDQYGESEATRTGMQRFNVALAQLGNAFDANNKKSIDLNTELRNQNTLFRELAIEALDSGLSIEAVERQMRDLAYSGETVKAVVDQMKALKAEANSGLTGLTDSQRAVAEAARDSANAIKSALKGVKDEIKRLDEEIKTHRDKLKTALDAETAGWQALGDEAKSAYDGVITEIDAVTQAQREAVDAAEWRGPAAGADSYGAALARVQAERSRLASVEQAGRAASQELVRVQEQQRANLERLNGERGKSLPVMQAVANESDRLAERERALNAVIAEGTSAGERIAAIQASLLSERDAATQRAAIYRADATARIEATRQYQSEALFLIDEEYARRKQAARASGESERAINLEYLQAKRATLQEIESAYRSHIDTLNAEAQRHLDAVRRIEDEISSLKMSTEDRIRELQRGAMSDYEAYQDRKRQAAEKVAAAERALAEGNYTLAKELAGQAGELYAQNAREVKDGERVMVSAQQAASAATAGYRTASDVKLQALEAEKTAHQGQADAAKTAATETEAALKQVAGQIDDLSSKLDQELNLKIIADSSAVTTEIGKIEALLKNKEAMVKISADLTALQEGLKKADQLLKDNPAKLEIILDQTEKTLGELKAYAAKLGDDVEIKAQLTLGTDRALKGVEDVRGKLLELNDFKTDSQHTVKANVDDILREIRALDGKDTSSTHAIYVKKVQTNATGGLVGLAQRFASGGAVPGFPEPRWSTVPGVGNTDSVPAALAPGSFVLKKAASRYYGSSLLDLISRFASGGRVPSLLMPGERLFQPDTVSRLGAGFFDALNQMRLPREQILAALGNMTAPVARFAAGGSVGATPAPAAASGSARESIDINLQIGGQRVQLQGPRDQAQALASALRTLQRQL
jgi:tape measure domain-containing protein